MSGTVYGLNLWFGKGYPGLLPKGWTLEEIEDDWAIGISPKGKRYYIGQGVAYPQRLVRKEFGSMKVGDHYLDRKRGVIFFEAGGIWL